MYIISLIAHAAKKYSEARKAVHPARGCISPSSPPSKSRRHQPRPPCIPARLPIHTHRCTYTDAHAHAHLSTHVHMFIYIYTHISLSIYIFVQNTHYQCYSQSHARRRLHQPRNVHTCPCAATGPYTCNCANAHSQATTHTRMHIHICRCTLPCSYTHRT